MELRVASAMGKVYRESIVTDRLHGSLLDQAIKFEGDGDVLVYIQAAQKHFVQQ